jgi:hypothetical protein
MERVDVLEADIGHLGVLAEVRARRAQCYHGA